MDINLALHEAIAASDHENFDRLLHHPDVDINYKNAKGKPPLMMSINKDVGSTMALNLIRAGCDIHYKSPYGENPLGEAIKNNLIDVACEVILRGADVNASSLYKHTPLYRAISYGNLEAVCLLLYYQADVNTTVAVKYWYETHLLHAVVTDRQNICEVLLDYCDDFSFLNDDANGAFDIAVRNQNPLAIDILKRGADMTIPKWCFFYCPIEYIVRYGEIEIFKLIWPTVDWEFIYDNDCKFMDEFIHECDFSNSEWLECFHVMLNTPVFRPLMEHYRSMYLRGSILEVCILGFLRRNIKLNNRISFIYSYLSLSVEIIADDLQIMYLLFGSNDEFEAVVYAGELSYDDYKEQMRLLFKEPFDSTIPVDIYKELYVYNSEQVKLEKTFCSLGFSSMSPEKRKRYLDWIEKMPKNRNIFLEELNKVPQHPSLLELSRDQAQKFIEEKFKIVKAYQFYDVVKNLKLPPIIEDVILFKQPIY